MLAVCFSYFFVRPTLTQCSSNLRAVEMGSVSSNVCGENSTIIETPPVEALSDEEIQIVVETWKIPAKNLIDSGEAILFRFLEKFPHNQQKFVAFRNTPLLQLKGTPGFRTHAAKVITVFDSSIDCLKCLDQGAGLEAIEKQWLDIGRSHAKRKVFHQEFMVSTMATVIDKSVVNFFTGNSRSNSRSAHSSVQFEFHRTKSLAKAPLNHLPLLVQGT